MGALWSLVLEGKVTSFLYYKFPWTILVICLSFWAELKNFDRNFGDGILDDCRRHYDKRTFAQSPSGKPPETLEPQKCCLYHFDCVFLITVTPETPRLQRPWSPKIGVSFFLKVGRFHRNGATFWQSIYFPICHMLFSISPFPRGGRCCIIYIDAGSK